MGAIGCVTWGQQAARLYHSHSLPGHLGAPQPPLADGHVQGVVRATLAKRQQRPPQRQDGLLGTER